MDGIHRAPLRRRPLPQPAAALWVLLRATEEDGRLDAARDGEVGGVRGALRVARDDDARPRDAARALREELLEAEVLIYLRGLGFSTERRAEAAAAEQNRGGPWGKAK